MAEETKAPAAEAPAAAAEEVVVSDVPVAEKPEAPAVVEKEAEPEAAGEAAVEGEKEKNGVAESTSFKEESNKVEELPNPEKKALDEFKQLIQEALNKHEFTAPPPPPPTAAPAKEEEEKKPAEEEPKSETKETEAPAVAEESPAAVPEEPRAAVPEPETAPKEEEEEKAAPAPPPPPPTEETPAEPAVVVVDEKAAPPAEEIKETIVEVAAAAPPAEDPATADAAADCGAVEEVPPPVPEEVSIWGIPLLADERSDVILLKFLRARDFKVKEAFTMLKSVVAWRKEFKIEELLEESELGQGLDKVVYMHGVDKEGHPICYNSFGEFQDKELYQSTFSDKEKLNKFLRWRIQFMEKSIRNLDFSPDGICTFVQVIDLKNSPGLFFFKKELRQATNRALQLLQDNYPEFVAKQVFVNVPWWYPSYYRMINALFTTRTKSKFVFAGPSKSAETLFKYIAPEQVPVQYGGLSREGDYEFTTADPAIEDTIKPTCKHTIELPVTENCTLVWEARVVGWDISYGAEFVPADEGAYTIIVEKSRKIGSADETIIGNTYKAESAGKVVLTFDNQTSKRKKLLYRSKTKAL
ncbi:patellin-3-like [Ipomoea triloba]|uniref:patellin-3-like n=1 Tax=Ipomoea triloba TaxID=35885 RepID=UPI00125E3177|nr:patellin-3-like [Ipomoea triloba]